MTTTTDAHRKFVQAANRRRQTRKEDANQALEDRCVRDLFSDSGKPRPRVPEKMTAADLIKEGVESIPLFVDSRNAPLKKLLRFSVGCPGFDLALENLPTEEDFVVVVRAETSLYAVGKWDQFAPVLERYESDRGDLLRNYFFATTFIPGNRSLSIASWPGFRALRAIARGQK